MRALRKSFLAWARIFAGRMIRFFTLFSGSSGNCALVTAGTTNFLIDAGVSCARICTALKQLGIGPSELDGVLITHEHTDHISGAGVLSRKFNIPLYSSEKTLAQTYRLVGGVYEHNLRCIQPGVPFSLRDFDIYPFSIPHDAADPVGYSMASGGRRLTVATDLGHITDALLKGICKSDAAVIESNHDVEMLKKGKYPYFLKKRILGDLGHLSNEKAAWLATQLAKWGTQKIVLAHLSKENNLPGLAYQTTERMFVKNGIREGRDVLLKVAPRSDILEI